MIGRSTRFGRWLAKDDRIKEQFLGEIENGASESVALERIGGHTATLREWLREDEEFARAVRVARRGELGEPRFYDLAAYAEPVPGAEKHPWMRREPEREPAPEPAQPQLTIAQREILERELGRGDPPLLGQEWTIPPGGWR